MPVLTKINHKKFLNELTDRYRALLECFESRELSSPKEGCNRAAWIHPELLCATKGSASDLRMRVSDFKTVLSEIGRLK
jgi:hypothetical protein